MVPVCPGDHLRPRMSLDPADHIIDPGDHTVQAFPGWLQLRLLSSVPCRTVQPDFVPFLQSREVGQAVRADLRPVTDHFQMLSDIMIDIMSPIHEVHHLVCRRLLLVGESPKQQVTGQACLIPEHYAGGRRACGLMH